MGMWWLWELATGHRIANSSGHGDGYGVGRGVSQGLDMG